MISDLAVTDITDNSVSLSWADTTNHGSYVVRYHTSPVSIDDTVGTLVNASTNSITINGLNPATTYYFTVASDCGGTYGYAMSTSARTNCTGFLAIPYTTDFEDLTTGQLPSCWDALQTGSSSAGTFLQHTNTHTMPSTAMFTSSSRTALFSPSSLPCLLLTASNTCSSPSGLRTLILRR